MQEAIMIDYTNGLVKITGDKVVDFNEERTRFEWIEIILSNVRGWGNYNTIVRAHHDTHGDSYSDYLVAS